MKIGFVSLGCAKNLVDSEGMMTMLTQEGHQIVSDPQQAEAIIVNTCGFIESAKSESIQTIFEMAKYKEKQCQRLIVVGCLAQRYQAALEQDIPEIDAVIPIRDYDRLADILRPMLGQKEGALVKTERVLSGSPWQAYLKISEGCSNRCSYCAIPLIRGNQVSRPMEEILKEAKQLAQMGVKECTVIAQDTTRYGLDLTGEYLLPELLRQLDELDFHWIRVLYMYPDEIQPELLEVMAQSKKILPYFDIPMQHASDRMLKAMNRRSSAKSLLALMAQLRQRFENPTLRTTLIVGFPQETEEDFNALLDFVKQARWDRLGAFTYSDEEDTPAYEMEGKVDPDIAQARLDKLMSLQKEIVKEKTQAMIGQVVEVLIEKQDALNKEYHGRSKADAPDEVDGQVIFKANQSLRLGQFVQVKITDTRGYDLVGVCLD